MTIGQIIKFIESHDGNTCAYDASTREIIVITETVDTVARYVFKAIYRIAPTINAARELLGY